MDKIYTDYLAARVRAQAAAEIAPSTPAATGPTAEKVITGFLGIHQNRKPSYPIAFASIHPSDVDVGAPKGESGEASN